MAKWVSFLACCLAQAASKAPREWPDHVIKVTMNYSMMKNEATGYSPCRLMHSREAKTPLSMLFPAMQKANPEPISDIVRDQVADMARVATIVRRVLKVSQIRRCRRHDKRICHTPFLQEGQWAMSYVDMIRADNTGNMVRRWCADPGKLSACTDQGSAISFTMA